MTIAQVKETIQAFAQGARRAREAGLDGVELHAANGYLFTQFLSSAINDRDDEYGGTLENRARFLLNVVGAIRAEAGADFHLQVKISATEMMNAILNTEGRGNTIEDSVQVAKWLEEAGVDAIHVSAGGYFPHPRNPVGELPIDDFLRVYDTMISSGTKTFRNYILFRNKLTATVFAARWKKAAGTVYEGVNLGDCTAVKKTVGIPVICTGGFQTASVVRSAIEEGRCDAVSIARPLIANNDLVQQWARGVDRPATPCTYCNKCLVNVVENPLGCYDVTRFASRDEMLAQILSVYDPPPFTAAKSAAQ